MQDRLIFHACPADLWAEAVANGAYSGRPIDHQDGFLHFSSARQLAETLALHMEGQTGLVLLTVETQTVVTQLKWEVSRGGAAFPHLYGPLAVDDVLRVDLLPVDGAGRHQLPDHVLAEMDLG